MWYTEFDCQPGLTTTGACQQCKLEMSTYSTWKTVVFVLALGLVLGHVIFRFRVKRALRAPNAAAVHKQLESLARQARMIAGVLLACAVVEFVTLPSFNNYCDDMFFKSGLATVFWSAYIYPIITFVACFEWARTSKVVSTRAVQALTSRTQPLLGGAPPPVNPTAQPVGKPAACTNCGAEFGEFMGPAESCANCGAAIESKSDGSTSAVGAG
jgi:uncharacterized protein (DUF983 family)